MDFLSFGVRCWKTTRVFTPAMFSVFLKDGRVGASSVPRKMVSESDAQLGRVWKPSGIRLVALRLSPSFCLPE
jgi:hypothetical protein